MHQLMDLIEKQKRVEDNQNQSKGKVRIFTLDPRNNWPDQYEPSHPRREFFSQAPHNPIGPQMVNSVFKELIYWVLEKIKNDPYFKWSNKMGGDPNKRNQNLYCQYHYTTEDCKILQLFLSQFDRPKTNWLLVIN